MRKIKVKIKHFVLIFLLFTYLTFLFTIDVVYTNLNDPESAFGNAFMVFATDVYEPELKENSIVVVKRITDYTRTDLAVDDYIVYEATDKEEEYTICQPVKKIWEENLYFQTVEEDGREDKIHWSQAKGVIVLKCNFLAPLVTLLLKKQRTAVFAVGTAIFILLMTCYLIIIRTNKRKQNEEGKTKNTSFGKDDTYMSQSENSSLELLKSTDRSKGDSKEKKDPICPKCGNPLKFYRNVAGFESCFAHEKNNKCKLTFANRSEIEKARKKMESEKETQNLAKASKESAANSSEGKTNINTKAAMAKPSDFDIPEVTTVSLEEFEKAGGDIFKLGFMEERILNTIESEKQGDENYNCPVEVDEEMETPVHSEDSLLVKSILSDKFAMDDDECLEEKSLQDNKEEIVTSEKYLKDESIMDIEESEETEISVEENTFVTVESTENEDPDENGEMRKMKALRMPLAGKKEKIQALLHEIDESTSPKKERRAVVIRKEVVKYVDSDGQAVTEIEKAITEPVAENAAIPEQKVHSASEKLPVGKKDEAPEVQNEHASKTTLLEDDDDEYGKTTILTDDEEGNGAYCSTLINVETGEVIPIDRPVFTIGCKRSCNLVVEEVGNHYVSRVHATIYLKNDTAYIKDLSSNGTSLGDESNPASFIRIPADTEVELKDEICIKLPKNRLYIFRKGR